MVPYIKVKTNVSRAFKKEERMGNYIYKLSVKFFPAFDTSLKFNDAYPKGYAAMSVEL